MIVLALKEEHSLQHLLQVCGLAKSVYYYQAKACRLPGTYEYERDEISKIYSEHYGRYGYRRIHLALRNKGIYLNHKTVYKLMKELGLKSIVRAKKYSSYRGEQGKAADNILKRDFYASQPNKKWVTDVTEFKVKDQKVYLSPIVDLFNQEVISYKVSKSVHLPLVIDMLKDAITTLPKGVKPIVHSDQGWQYRHNSYKKLLTDKGLTQSMSRKGNCLDNAVAENFFALLKTEMYHVNSFRNADELIEQIKDYIEYYNTKRIKVKLKGMTPVEYRNQALMIA